MVNQHIFPKCSIERFCERDGFVDVFILSNKKRFPAKSENPIFCVRRSWDERSETGYGKNIEDRFQEAIEKVLQGKSPNNDHISQSITEFYCLWQIRERWSKLSIENESLGVRPEFPLDINEMESLEKAHVVYVNNDGEIPARTLRGFRMQQSLDDAVGKMSGIKWGMLTALEGEFLVPDNFSRACIVPVSSNQCFVANHDSKSVNLETVDQINLLAISSASKYIFARDLNCCPGFSEILQNPQKVIPKTSDFY